MIEEGVLFNFIQKRRKRGKKITSNRRGGKKIQGRVSEEKRSGGLPRFLKS